MDFDLWKAYQHDLKRFRWTEEEVNNLNETDKKLLYIMMLLFDRIESLENDSHERY